MPATTPQQRVYNFSAGPAVLPVPVLEQVRDEMLCLPGVGASILEISHRGAAFTQIIESAEANLRKLLDISDDYAVLFIQGGSRLQFSMVPMNFIGEHGANPGKSGDYLITGSWGKQALEEAVKVGPCRAVYNSKATNFDRLPAPFCAGEATPQYSDDAAFVHYTCNETIQGVQFPGEPETGGIPLVCDASSDFLHRKLDVSKYGLIYACAQKNAGPAGVTIVIVKKDLVASASDSLPVYCNYNTHIEANSLNNTPPTFAIYVVQLVTQWLLDTYGSLDAVHKNNAQKAKLLYDLLDESPDFYQGHAQPECRSLMNVAFRLPSEDLTAAFLSGGKQHGLTDLKGHRSVGGIRASIYNAMPIAGVETLRDYMVDFRNQHAG
ncbi:3-phosphoserine/phosphohydroxythreonine transaminase [Botrimarina hoheduenensis]|uniref:Phosphoserine aminotransferase n=1 Tax=Botrimarina hoheduenensis TaxID=2528000 RepID=A0A5C5WE54_9BACT|nr:3-phosphoserine/phosphohydroxythreonine transaminase [Botrimarina hoheduenensis]TWT48890.1 Phosphoserine aminotransferase [Botrimarina hoheduenensis]